MKFRIIFVCFSFLTSLVFANELPSEVVALEKSFRSVPGIKSVEVGKHYFSKDDITLLSKIYFSGEYADLPIAMYRRSGGNLKNEILINVAFDIEPNTTGLKALEFLSWWVRDLSKSGDNVQIRTIGLPPISGETVQLGNTLSFWFEAYITTEREDMALVLDEVAELSNSLNSSFNMYKSAFAK